ncbi:hypothetical protein CWD77_06540 [Rhodohalobacter barkolensis]|uniref:Uncharacterized protein n=1 Tax=Rhodohalobacter barkolensis TaxID=2053187 RepID=A0A2N0VLM6_9BACT|nr:hypothetical protein CWD77_06540 [Rhodohalobacter barkolensis]
MLFDRFLFALDPDDRLDELLLLTVPLLLLFDELRRLTDPLLRLFEDDLFRLTEPLLLLFERVRLTVPDDRFVFVRDRFTVLLLFDLDVALDRMELADRVLFTVLLLLFT